MQIRSFAFDICTYHFKDAAFSRSTFKGEASFNKAKFRWEANFYKSNFKQGEADFYRGGFYDRIS